jgi:hypothetical protein
VLILIILVLNLATALIGKRRKYVYTHSFTKKYKCWCGN